MSAAGQFRALQAGDLEYIAANLREADRQELTALQGEGASFLDILQRAARRSSHLWVGAVGDEPVSVFGAAPISLLEGIGTPWFLSTDEAYKYPRTLISEGRRYLSDMLVAYPHLYNYVDARNTRSVRWLRHIGFEVHDAKPHGALGLPFHKFEIKGR